MISTRRCMPEDNWVGYELAIFARFPERSRNSRPFASASSLVSSPFFIRPYVTFWSTVIQGKSAPC